MRPIKKYAYKEIQPALEIYEWHRKEAVKNKNRFQSFVVILGFILLIALIISGKFTNPLYLIFSFVTFILLMFASIKNAEVFDKNFLKDLIQVLLLRKEIEANYLPSQRISGTQFLKSKLFQESNDFSGTNLINGSFDNVSFEASNLTARLMHYDGSIENIYQGFFASFKTRKSLYHRLKISTKDYNNERPHMTVKNKVDLSSFGGTFTTTLFSSNSSEVLSPEFKEKLLAFRKKYNTPFVLNIIRNRIYFAMPKHKIKFSVLLDFNLDNKIVVDKIDDECDFIVDLTELINSIGE